MKRLNEVLLSIILIVITAFVCILIKTAINKYITIEESVNSKYSHEEVYENMLNN